MIKFSVDIFFNSSIGQAVIFIFFAAEKFCDMVVNFEQLIASKIFVFNEAGTDEI